MSAANTRLSPQQIMQVQAQVAQARAMAVVQAQAQAQIANINGVGPHMSPPYTSRAATSSPAQASPPRNANTPTNAGNPPRPLSAQPQPGMASVPQVPGNTMPRPTNVIGHFFPSSIQSVRYNPEQVGQMLHLQTALEVCRVQSRDVADGLISGFRGRQ
jgi:chromatin modification-related protein VID21